MKKILKPILYIILILLGGLIGKLLVNYSMTGQFGSNHCSSCQEYENKDLGWLKTSLPFSLQADQTLKNQIANSQFQEAIESVQTYKGTYDKKLFALAISHIVYASTIKPDPLTVLASTIAGSGYDKNEVNNAIKNAIKSNENGSIKYKYQVEASVGNSPSIFGIVLCVKNNQSILVWAQGYNTKQNKDIVNHVLNDTVCFTENQ
jgi:hypothetical protein